MYTIQILGISGSEKTTTLRANVIRALREMSTLAIVEHVTDVDKFIQYDINGIPALILNGTVVLQKQIPTLEDLKILLRIFATSSNLITMKKILVPTDFSNISKAAFQYALELAKVQNSEIKVLHVYHPDFDPQSAYLTEPIEVQKKISDKQLENFVQTNIASLTPAPENVSYESMIGFPVEEILNQCDDETIVVMGKTGSGGILQKVFGSVSVNVARRANCPVILVPEGTKSPGIRHILYASDFVSANENTLEKLVNFAGNFKADIHFVHVMEENNSESYKEIENNFFKILFRSGEPAYSFTMSKVAGQSVADGLYKYATEHSIDLMVLVSPQRPFWENLFHKSTTKSVASTARYPIMVLHC